MKNILVILIGCLVGSSAFAEAPNIRLLGQVKEWGRAEDFTHNDFLEQRGAPAVRRIPGFALDLGNDEFAMRLYYDRVHQGEDASDDFSRVWTFGFEPRMRITFINSAMLKANIDIGGILSYAEVDYRVGTSQSFADSGLGYGALASFGIALGYKTVFLCVDAGYRYNNHPGIDHKMDPNKGIHNIDLSGAYVAAGLMFRPDGN